MTLLNTRRTFFAIDVHPATRRYWFRWGLGSREGCVFRGPFWFDVAWFGGDGDRWLHLGPFVFGFARNSRTS